MNFKILIFVSGIIQILGRPTLEDNELDSGNNIYLLPAVFHANDLINITIHITKKTPEVISIDFMGDDEESTDTAFFSIKTDYQTVTICKESDGSVAKQKMDSVFDSDEMNFNLWLQRRENKQDVGEYNVIQVYTKYYTFEPITVDNINKIRYLKINGGNAKMINLEFEFA